MCRYLRWNLKDNSGLVVRCEYDAVVSQPGGGGKSFINVRALNELGPKKVCFKWNAVEAGFAAYKGDIFLLFYD